MKQPQHANQGAATSAVRATAWRTACSRPTDRPTKKRSSNEVDARKRQAGVAAAAARDETAAVRSSTNESSIRGGQRNDSQTRFMRSHREL